MNYFYFYKDLSEITALKEGKIIRIPEKMNDSFNLFVTLESLLEIPEEFGRNWDAFLDNLRQLFFIKEKNVYLIHSDIPFEANKTERRIYLEILFSAVRHWWEYPEHKLYVYFPERYKTMIEKIIETRDYP
ncbi:MAG: barstar family protein [Chlamydiales bacterium]|nr:barstar family protein [Chlamydiales bacterium]